MFGTIRKHQTWLWAIIITLTIISFLYFFSPYERSSGGRSGAAENFGVIAGKTISRQQFVDAYHEEQIRYRISNGSWPGRDSMTRQRDDLDQAARRRVFLKMKMKDAKVEVSPAAAAQWIAESPLFRDPQTKAFRAEAYDSFIKQLLPEQGLREADFVRFVQHEVGIQRLTALHGVSGSLVTPAEAESMYREEHEEFVASVVRFDVADFLAKVNVANSNLSQFYSNRLSVYRLPDRMQVNYVKFVSTNFLADADKKMNSETNLNAQLDMIYERRGAKFFVDEKNVELPPAAAKQKIREEMRKEYASMNARKKAAEFAEEIDSMKPASVDNLKTLAAKHKFTVEVSQPFSEFEPPADLKVFENFTRRAFAMTADEPYAGPLQTDDGYLVIAPNKKIPSEIPPMESILQRVMDDYRTQQAIDLARETGAKFAKTAKAELAKNKKFSDICAAEKVKPVTAPAFSLSTRTLADASLGVSLFDLQNVTHTMSPGQVSVFNPTREGGFVVFLMARNGVAEDKLKADLPEFIAGVRQSRQMQAFQEWFRREADAAKLGAAPATQMME